MLRASLLALVLVLPAGAWAGTASFGCNFSGTSAGVAGTAVGFRSGKTTLIANDIWCYRFVVGDGVHNTIVIHSDAQSNLITFDPDIFDTAVSTARVIPHFCPQGTPVDTANPLRSCPSMGGANGNASLDGTEGSASAQNASVRVGPGTLIFEISAACAAGDTCQITVQGEGESQ